MRFDLMRYDGVYILHFNEGAYKHARHYVGYSRTVKRRVSEHRRGKGVPLTRAARQANITFSLARVFWGKDWTFEKRIRQRHNTPMLCPICNPRAFRYPLDGRTVRDIDADIPFF